MSFSILLFFVLFPPGIWRRLCIAVQVLERRDSLTPQASSPIIVFNSYRRYIIYPLPLSYFISFFFFFFFKYKKIAHHQMIPENHRIRVSLYRFFFSFSYSLVVRGFYRQCPYHLKSVSCVCFSFLFFVFRKKGGKGDTDLVRSTQKKLRLPLPIVNSAADCCL